ncbi:MAG: DUF494 domain-containing protein [Betaproteobacteria bacterium]|nr:DUF494 domain-containing protein [Betaproteobacteria bacterium]
MFDILVYLFENCQQADLTRNSESVAKKLSAAGFDDSEISETLAWLAGVQCAPNDSRLALLQASRAPRAFALRECIKLDAGSRGFLISLEQAGVLDAGLRELVIDLALTASAPALSLDQLKLIVLMVLWNHHVPTSQLIAGDLLSADVTRTQH